MAHSSERTLAGAPLDALLQLEGAYSLVFRPGTASSWRAIRTAFGRWRFWL
jgi:hypothetical protein